MATVCRGINIKDCNRVPKLFPRQGKTSATRIQGGEMGTEGVTLRQLLPTTRHIADRE